MALDLLKLYQVHILRVSSYYISEPWGVRSQDDFINAVAEVSFDGTASELLSIVLEVEKHMGRIRRVKWGPRLIDIDILEFKREIHKVPDLSIPHPFYPMRNFVLIPFAELEPDWIPTGGIENVSILADRYNDGYILPLVFTQEKVG